MQYLAGNTDKNIHKLFAFGGCEIILKVITIHTADVAVFERGCAAIANLAFIESIRSKLVDLDAFNLVRHNMSTYHSSNANATQWFKIL